MEIGKIFSPVVDAVFQSQYIGVNKYILVSLLLLKTSWLFEAFDP
jgi:hypothetical protein